MVLRDGICDKLPAGAAPEGCPYLEPYDEGRRLAFYDAHCSGHCFREGLRALSNTSALLSRDAHQLAAHQFQACREDSLHGLENVRQHQAYHIRRLEMLGAAGRGQGRGPVNGGGVAKNGYPHHHPQPDPRVDEELRRIAAENLTVRLRSEQMDVAREATARDVAELASKVAAMHEVIDEMLLSYQYLALVGHGESVAAADPRGREEEQGEEEEEEEEEEVEEVGVEQHHGQPRKRSHGSSTPGSEASFATEVRGPPRGDR